MLLCIMLINAEIKRKPELVAGVFLLLTGFSVILSLLTNIEFLSAFLSLSEDIEYLHENRLLLEFNSLLWVLTALLLIISSASLIAAIVPHHSFLGYLQGFFLIMAAGMFCVAGIKGLTLGSLMENYLEINLTNPDSIKTNVLILSNEKGIYLTTGYNLIGLNFFVMGIFAYLTSKIPLMTGILGSLTGIFIPLFTLFIPDSLFADVGLIMACLMFFILTIRFLFKGLEKKQKRTRKKSARKNENLLST